MADPDTSTTLWNSQALASAYTSEGNAMAVGDDFGVQFNLSGLARRA